MALLTTSTINSNGDYELPTDPGQRYILGIGGNANAFGSIAVSWLDSDNNPTAFPDSPMTARGGFEFIAPTNFIRLAVTGKGSGTHIIACNPVY
jgi:hypothetical protein